MENDNKELNANELDTVSGGSGEEIVKDQNGVYRLIPEDAPKFENEEDAKNALERSKIVNDLSTKPLKTLKTLSIAAMGGTNEDLDTLNRTKYLVDKYGRDGLRHQ